MTLDELRALDVHRIGLWPQPVLVGIFVVVFLIIIGAGYGLVVRAPILQLNQLRQQETQLRQSFIAQQQVMANLPHYQRQLSQMQTLLNDLVLQLPTKTEMPDLLENISDLGRRNGLVFDLFKPEAEQPREFYAAQPISIRARGTYHQLGGFISDIGRLPRIVTLKSAQLAHLKASPNPAGGQAPAISPDMLEIEAILQTYRYLGLSAAPQTETP